MICGRWMTLALAAFAVAGPARTEEASRLDAFARDATRPVERGEHRDERELRRPGDADAFDDLFGGFLGEVFVGGLWFGGAGSLARIDERFGGDEPDEQFHRVTGEGLIPFLRLDADHQWIDPGLDAWNFSAELGYGPVAAVGRLQRFDEDEPESHLDLYEVALLYRMSFGRHVEIDLGAGAVQLDGASDDARGTLPLGLRVHAREGLGLEFRASLAQQLEIYDVALLAGPRFAGLKAGWRWTRSPDESLDGPYVGAAVFF